VTFLEQLHLFARARHSFTPIPAAFAPDSGENTGGYSTELPGADGSPRREQCCGNKGGNNDPDRTTPAEPNKDHKICLMNSHKIVHDPVSTFFIGRKD
jgi:hypothetical protein